jgi:hypothetical protein
MKTDCGKEHSTLNIQRPTPKELPANALALNVECPGQPSFRNLSNKVASRSTDRDLMKIRFTGRTAAS